MNLKEFFKAWQKTQNQPKDYVVVKMADGEEIKADMFHVQAASMSIEGGKEIIFFFYKKKRVATVQVEDIKDIYCGYDNKTENKILTIEEFKELWNKSAQFDSYFKYVIKYTTIVDKCGTRIEAKDYMIDFTNEGDVIINLYNENGFIAEVKLKNIIEVY